MRTASYYDKSLDVRGLLKLKKWKLLLWAVAVILSALAVHTIWVLKTYGGIQSEGLVSLNESREDAEITEEDKALNKMIEDMPDATCDSIARQIAEPYSDEYKNQKIDLNGPVYAFHTWNDPIDKSMIDIQKTTPFDDCRLVFKVIDRELYIYENTYCYNLTSSAKREPALHHRRKLLEELILVALQVFVVPDVDFVVIMGDKNTADNAEKLSALSFCIGPNSLYRPGFTFPDHNTYLSALGKTQYAAFKKCQKKRYPLNGNRRKKAVWRGAPTRLSVVNPTNLLQNRRVSLAHLGQLHPELIDAKIVNRAQMADDSSLVERLEQRVGEIGGFMPMEKFNEYAYVIDIDGNSWSKRLPNLLASNTPILKQEYSSYVEYFGHLLEDEKHLTFFDVNLLDLLNIAEYRMVHWDSLLEKTKEQVKNANEFAAEHVSQIGVIRAMAYTLTKFASLMTWTVKVEDGYVEIPPEVCCEHQSLPPGLVRKMKG